MDIGIYSKMMIHPPLELPIPPQVSRNPWLASQQDSITDAGGGCLFSNTAKRMNQVTRSPCAIATAVTVFLGPDDV
jgi:hypothetical protein